MGALLCCGRGQHKAPEQRAALLQPHPPQPQPQPLDLPLPLPTTLLPEYAAALRRVVLHPALLTASPFQSLLARLARAAPRPPPAPAALLHALVRRAFGLPSDAAARSFAAALPLLELPAPLPLLPACAAFLAALTWEKSPVCTALALLLRSEGQDGMVVLVGLMAQASTSCMSRRRAAVCSILLKAQPLLDKAGVVEEGEGEAGKGPLAALQAALAVGSPAAAAAAARLRAAACAWVQDLKDRAFDSVFLQPMRLYAAAATPPLEYVLLDAEVHGAPSLAALLQAATGICVSRAPELRDEATGFADAVAAGGMGAQLAALWAPGAAGRSWESLRGCAGAAPLCCLSGSSHSAPADVFCGWRGSRWDAARIPTVRAFALQAVDAGEGNAVRRRFFARSYLAAFAAYFAEESGVVGRLADALMAGHGEDVALVVGGAGGLLEGSSACSGGGGAEAAGEWLYDMEAFPPVLRVERAWALLELLGVLLPRQQLDAQGGALEGGLSEAEPEWACELCTCLNAAHEAVCGACETERPVLGGGGAAAMAEEGWVD